MARKKRSSAAKAQVDARPETSPYASKTCTLPFASPLSVPHEVLIKSPKLYAAYESNLPELPQISEDVGHVLVHYLHTGKYETLKPKSSEDISKQIVELKTSIQAYAAARAYELTELMRLSEIQIERHGEGLPLPTLLEVARDAHPTLTDNDNWFLDFLRARIRPHLRDAKALRESDLLDRISSILSPNRVLLRTVLELFCENIGRAPTPPPAAAAAAAAPQAAEKQKQQPRQAPQSELPFSSPISSPDISRPGSPLPQANGVPREDSHSSSSSLKKKTPTWSSLDQTTMLEEVPRQVVAEPTEVSLPSEEAQSKPGFDLDDIIADDEPEQVHEVVEEIKKDDFKPLALTEDKAVAEPENKTEVTPAPAVEAETEVKLAVEPEIPEPILEPEAEPEVKAAPEVVKKAAPFPIVIPQKQRERADSAKVIDMEPPVEAGEFKALPILEEVPGVPIAIPDSMPAVESSSTKRVAYRQADSGFWDATPSPSLREGPSSIPEFEVAPVTVEPVADIETFGVTESKQDKVVDTKEGKTTEEEVARETATSEAVEAPISSVLSSPTLLPSHFDLPAEILEATALSAAANAEPEPETKENEKEKSVSPPVPTEPSTEEAKTTTESDLPDSAVVETAAVPAATESADTDAISTPAPATKVVDAPNADDTTGPSDAKTSEPEPQQPESQPESEHAELTTIPEQLEPVEATKPSEEQPKPAAPAAVEVVPAVGAVQQQVSKPTPTSSSASLHVGGLRGLRKSRSRRSNRGSTVSLSAANAPQTAEQQAGAQDSPIPVPAPAPAKVSGSGGGWKKKWLRYPVLFGKGM